MLDKHGKKIPPKKKPASKKAIPNEVIDDEIKGIKTKKQIPEVFNPHAINPDGSVQLIMPKYIPGRGRVMAMVLGKKETISDGGIILPGVKNTQNERFVNPFINNDFRVVAFHSEVSKEFTIKENAVEKHPNTGFATYKGKNSKLDMGDYIMFGAEFIPPTIEEGPTTYAIVHYMDIIAVEKAPIELKGPEDIIKEGSDKKADMKVK